MDSIRGVAPNQVVKVGLHGRHYLPRMEQGCELEASGRDLHCPAHPPVMKTAVPKCPPTSFVSISVSDDDSMGNVLR